MISYYIERLLSDGEIAELSIKFFKMGLSSRFTRLGLGTTIEVYK